MTRKLLSILLAVAMLGCCALPAFAEETYTVGICQLVQHEALDAATKGF